MGGFSEWGAAEGRGGVCFSQEKKDEQLSTKRRREKKKS
jgi:hypothetical protein